jgi:hypothetical protein
LIRFKFDADAMRAHALAQDFYDWQGHDGEVYKRVWLGDVPGLLEAIEAAVGPVEPFGTGYRLNYAGELPNHAIHSDMGWGTHAAVLYLKEGDSGTAFWRHKATGADRIAVGDFDLYAKIEGDWDDASAWELIELQPCVYGEGIIYDNSRFHSRWPFEAFGTTPDDGRLIAVAFFTLKDEP